MIQLAFQAAAAFVALAAAIMAWRLERKLVRLKTGQDGMQAAAAALTEAVTRAEASVRTLRANGAETAQELEALIARARAAGDELRLVQGAGTRARAPFPAARSERPRAAMRGDEGRANVMRRDEAFDDMFDDTPAPRPDARRAPDAPDAALMDALRRVR